MYTLLFSAIKNFGDFLIYERTQALLRDYSGMGDDFVEIHGLRQSLEDNLDRVNETKALIICGGPGLQTNMYPGRYPLTTDLSMIRIPIIVLGSGWFGVPGDDSTVAQYRFSSSTMRLFDRIRSEGHAIGVRDRLSEQVLLNNDVTNVLMTGCPSWYERDNLALDFNPPAEIRTIAFTPPAKRMYMEQSIEVMRLLRKQFPRARVICSFHRGISADPNTRPEEAAWYQEIARIAHSFEFEVKDASYGPSNAGYYSECDMHVGYRVHGHIYFLSLRKPSFLVEEDGRGRGAAEALGSPSVQGWKRTAPGKVAGVMRGPKLANRLDKWGWLVHADPTIPATFDKIIRHEVETGFPSFTSIPTTIRTHHAKMVDFLKSIP